MCGIAGYWGDGTEEVLHTMADTLRHRGPDDAGYFRDGAIGLAHRRLSIIDTSAAGHQPMGGEDGRVQVVFNGEIYNFQELRKNLKEKHRFKSHSDTEVIIHLYEEIGVDVFSKLEGMFAIALYDREEKKLILARDKMGKKPLYYGVFGSTLIFGSELKALMAHPIFKKELNLSSLNKYLLYEYVPTPHTMFKGVYKLEPGHYAVYDGEQFLKTKFWDIPFNPDGKKEQITFAGALNKFDELLSQSVKKRLVSDVPLGVFLSGGIDSSTIAHYAQRIMRENNMKPVKTFSIGFSENSFDESVYAREVAAFLGTEHHEKILSAKDALALIPKIAEQLDEPLADASILPTFLLSQFAREYVTVALGGDGSDELLYGYDTFTAHKLAGIYEKIPKTLRNYVIEPVIHLLPSTWNNISLDFKAKKFVSGFYGEKKYRNQRWLGAFDKIDRARLFRKEVWDTLSRENEFDDLDRYLNKTPTNDYYDQLTHAYLRTYMMDDILVKVDRASMFNSLEVRVPFLDTSTIGFLINLPHSFKMRGFTKKYILKQLMRNKLPKSIVHRKKKGFGIPLAEWIAGDLKLMILELLSEERIKKQGLFNPEYIRTLLQEHFEKRADNRKLIWTLVMFQMWYERWYSKKS